MAKVFSVVIHFTLDQAYLSHNRFKVGERSCELSWKLLLLLWFLINFVVFSVWSFIFE